MHDEGSFPRWLGTLARAIRGETFLHDVKIAAKLSFAKNISAPNCFDSSGKAYY
jgi:hypothetical protein